MALVDTRREEVPVSEEAAGLYRLIADALPQLIWVGRADGALEYFNQRCYDYTGLDHGALAGWSWKAVVHPDDWERCLATWTRALQSGERYEIEYRLRRADGAYRWHHGSAVPLVDPRKRVLRWFGTCVDIEEQIRSAHILESMVAERTRALRETESRLREIIDNQPECVKLLDSRGRLLEMNPAGLRMIEAEAAVPLLGQSVYGLIADEHRAAFRDLTERVCRGERGQLQFEIVGFKGTRRWLETHAVPFREEDGGETRLLGITRDITDRKRAERALQESEQRFRSFMDNAPAAAWIKDSAFRYTYVNSTHSRIHALAAERVLGQDDFQVWPEEVARQFRAHDEAALRAGGPVQSLESVPYPDGRPGSWLVVKFPLQDGGGAPGIAGIGIDVTPRIAAEEQARGYASDVRRLMDRVVAAQESERRRLADDLHDLIGQNLTALGIDLTALKQRLAAGTTEPGRIDAMRALVEKTIDAIRGVMSDLRPPALEEFGLAPAMRLYASEFAERTGMKASISVSGEAARLARSTELALFRIFQEALTNAAKHSGGSAVLIGLMQAGDRVVLTVEDDGRGFVDPVGARSERRGGWGLPAMRERAEAHGGTLRIEFPVRGTRLSVELPVGSAP
jgi:PAS domain S-box-containing protein